MPRQQIDPIERALDAYFQLDDAQKRVFAMAVRHVERRILIGPDHCEPKDETKRRGRPVGSKTRNVQVKEPLRSVVNSIIHAGIHESAERAKTEHILSDIEKQTRAEFAPNAATEEGL